jgi:hypothetical protein
LFLAVLALENLRTRFDYDPAYEVALGPIRRKMQWVDYISIRRFLDSIGGCEG